MGELVGIKTEPNTETGRIAIYARTQFEINLRPVASKQSMCPPGFWLAHSRLLDDVDARMKKENYLNPKTRDQITRLNSLVRLFETVMACHRDYLDILTECANTIKELGHYCMVPFEVTILYPESGDEDERTVNL